MDKKESDEQKKLSTPHIKEVVNDEAIHVKPVKEVVEHMQSRILHEAVIVPEHAERKESETFRKAKKQLKEDGNAKCWICGKTKADGVSIESHHMWAEKSLENCVDFDKLKALCELFDIYGYASKMKDVPMTTVDDIRNQCCLCSLHHRMSDKLDGNSGVGIHNLTFPAWVIQKVCKDDMNPIPQPEDTEYEKAFKEMHKNDSKKVVKDASKDDSKNDFKSAYIHKEKSDNESK